ncbi:GntR family transcriptional regulator [Actinopolymorpha sp. NPDC004070]|uniref:GntR family transcriptional regulator n=1 Tax=Actinopolymorpha sp. NPDC004070 TaxID=3154548 RepID=UPI0033B355AE
MNGTDTNAPELPSLRGFRSLRDEVSAALRAALVSGQMRPGVVYSAPALAARFGVSATPVREAMLDLARTGLVEVVRNKGFRVTEVSEAELDDITELRRLIEVPTTAGLAGKVPAEVYTELRSLAQAIVDAARAGDLIGYVDADRRFHIDLLRLAGNATLVDTVADLRERTRLFGLENLAERGVLEASAREHLALLDLLEAGDGEAVRVLMHRHLGHVRGTWAGRAE